MITGCFMFFPSAVFWEVGGFDLNIFLYYEEIDICTRLRRKGYKSIYYPQVSFQHSQGESTNKQPSLTTIERYISRLYCYKKHHTYGLYIIYYLINLVKLIFHPERWFIFPFLLHGENMSHSMRHRKAMGKK
jgi:GT2 family glycosyltransferase